MKKTFCLIRHAKSSWKDLSLKDHDRPLNKRGKNDAPVMAKFLKENNMIPDLLLSSSAVRAYEFAKVIAEETGYGKKNIMVTKDLYMADENEMIKILRDVNDSCETVFMVGHNPGITFFANLLTNHNIDNIPTSGIFRIEFETDKWKDIGPGKGKFISFDYPKKFTN